jgi:hypothetical protein
LVFFDFHQLPFKPKTLYCFYSHNSKLFDMILYMTPCMICIHLHKWIGK